MAIAPVSSVSFRTHTPVNFGSKYNNDTEGQEFKPAKRRGTTDLSKMPVVVLLAMTPALAEAKMPENHSACIIPPATEIMYEEPEEKEDNFLIYMPKTQETQQSKAPFGYGGLRNDIVKMSHPFKSKGESCHLVFSSVKSNASNKVVEFAYVIYDNKKPNNSNSQTPPEIKKLIYHNIGKDKEFCGALIEEDIIGSDDKYKGTIRKEIRLDDDTAQKIIDLITNHSPYKNETTIRLEEVNTPNLHPVKVYE